MGDVFALLWTWRFWFVGLLGWVGAFVWHCGFRTAGEALFFYSQKKYPKKAVATPGVPVKGTGIPTEVLPVACCEKTHAR